MKPTATLLAEWAYELGPTEVDLDLSRRSLLDTVAVAIAAADHPVRRLLDDQPEALRWAALSHVLDFDDLHMPSTAHISAVCVPVALALGAGARAYLAGAGVMARLGTALSWSHYSSGWHTTCTAGAPAAAVTAGIALGLDPEQLAAAIALAVPAAGGVHRAFGTDAKALQVGFAAEAGVRAAKLAAAGATASPRALDDWMALVDAGGSVDLDGPAVPGGLAIKMFPCCYALQRPISAALSLGRLDASRVASVAVTTPESTVKPLIHANPRTGLEGKFSLQYALATALINGYPGFGAFTDEAVSADEAQALITRVSVTTTPGGEGLLAGRVSLGVETNDRECLQTELELPPGAPGRPPSPEDLQVKLEACALTGDAGTINDLEWSTAVGFLRERTGR